MAKYSGKKKVSEETREEALRLAEGTQRPGQSKEQTKLIAQGIQRGIDLYKKQQKAKARELDRKLRQAQRDRPVSDEAKPTLDEAPSDAVAPSSSRLPWVLLGLTWLGILVFVLVSYAGQS